MSTDWFLLSPSRKRSAMVGSIGLSGPRVWTEAYGADKFLLWAIEEHVTDVILVPENDQRLEQIEEDRE